MQTPTARCSINLRQGSVVVSSDLDLDSLGITLPADHNLYIVISHDCDIAASVDKEPTVELISCNVLIGRPSESFGKNVRLLHLPILHNGQSAHLKLEPRYKVTIPKSQLEAVSYNTQYQVAPESLRLLQNWLAARYRRHAFSENLAPRLSEIESEINKLGKKTDNTQGVIAIFLMIDPPEIDAELPEDEPYEIKFRVIYDSENEFGEANAKAFVQKIKDAVQIVQANGVCIHVPEILEQHDGLFTLKESNTWVQWRFEHLSFRGEQIGILIDP